MQKEEEKKRLEHSQPSVSNLVEMTVLETGTDVTSGYFG